MQPRLWQPPQDLTPVEEQIISRIRRAKLFVFLRQQRHLIFDAAFQAELAASYGPSAEGHPPLPPAQLALATIVQAYTGVSDDEVIEALEMDRRWQLVLDCVDCRYPPFSKGTLVAFRQRLIAHELDRRLIERTVEIAALTKGFGHKQLRAALDSSPLWGAGRVEDTLNLVGHALRTALGVLARQQGRELSEITAEAGAALLGQSSLKAALDADWEAPGTLSAALAQVLAMVETVAAYVVEQPPTAAAAAAQERVAVAQVVVAQDVVQPPTGPVALREGVAKDRRISVEDAEMRHGRKSKSQLIDGYKRHALHDLASGLVPAVGLTPAQAPEASVADAIVADLAHQGVRVTEWHIDRAYLSSTVVRDRAPDVRIICRAWPVRAGRYFAKTAFTLDWERAEVRCPGGHTLAFVPGGTVHFPTAVCAACPLRAQCTGSTRGRSVTIHPDERLLAELRERQATPAGRARLRERVAVEHTLAHLGRWQGDRARYCGQRKNLFDLRRTAVVHNLHVLARLPDVDPAGEKVA
jgi:hypothetical protein